MWKTGRHYIICDNSSSLSIVDELPDSPNDSKTIANWSRAMAFGIGFAHSSQTIFSKILQVVVGED